MKRNIEDHLFTINNEIWFTDLNRWIILIEKEIISKVSYTRGPKKYNSTFLMWWKEIIKVIFDSIINFIKIKCSSLTEFRFLIHTSLLPCRTYWVNSISLVYNKSSCSSERQENNKHAIYAKKLHLGQVK